MSNSYFAIIIVLLLCRNPAVETAATQTKKLHPFFSAIIFSCLGGGVLGWFALLISRKVLKPSSAQTSLASPQNQPPSDM